MFKSGDRVQVLPGEGSSFFKEGDVLVVASVSQNGFLGFAGGIGIGWGSWRFKLTSDKGMTENEKPFGLLSEAEQKILEDAGMENCERFNLNGDWEDMGVYSGFSKSSTYRLKKQPPRVKVSDLEGTVEMKDGKPDWDSYTE